MSDDGSEQEFKEEAPTVGTYEGERNEAKERHGKGKNVFPNGDVFEGHYEFGKRNGTGTYKWKNGTRYTGEYRDHLRHGQGVFVYLDGSRYSGSFEGGKRSGHGIYYYANGDTYEGKWEDDLKHGQGVYTFKPTNSKKKGTWVRGVLSGPGEIVHADHKISCSFVDNQCTMPAKIQFHSSGYTTQVSDAALLGLDALPLPSGAPATPAQG
ncbi:hypothetical protein BJ742DRAFT_7859 [Cladochytrium replicatum]|nr:hypothetical protein BJ742DRAFT_7859 [Cladochytrium replicatum]